MRRAAAALEGLAAFEGIGQDDLNRLAAGTVRRTIARGERFIREGEDATALYIVLRGRFIVSRNGVPIAEIAQGEPVGELGFFAGTPRTADVTALRSSEVLELTRDAYDQLARTLPGLSQSILASLARRLSRQTPKLERLRAGKAASIAVLPAAGDRLPIALIGELTRALSVPGSKTTVVDKALLHETSRDPAQWPAILDALEAENDRLVMIAEEDDFRVEGASWCRIIAGHSDAIYLAGPLGRAAAGPVALSALEKHVLGDLPVENVHCILWRERSPDPITPSANWLDQRSIALHHHLALDSAADFERLARFMRGEALGAVLSGGGAFGTAHLGAMKALREAGYRFDIYGGTSVGAAMAAALAIFEDVDEVMRLCDDIFIRSKAMRRLTVPLYSVLDHKRFDEQMRKHYGGYRVEDMPVNFFAVATSLTTNDRHIIRRGELWQAVRASSSIPAVFPPVILPDGEVLIDGALTDNVPVTIMRDLKPGANLILSFARRDDWRVEADYDRIPGRAGAARRMVMRRPGDPRFPGIFSVLSRTMVITARRLLDNTEIGDDILMEIPTLKGMGFLDWKSGRRQFDSAYRTTAQALEKGMKPGIEALRRTALAINDSDAG